MYASLNAVVHPDYSAWGNQGVEEEMGLETAQQSRGSEGRKPRIRVTRSSGNKFEVETVDLRYRKPGRSIETHTYHTRYRFLYRKKKKETAQKTIRFFAQRQRWASNWQSFTIMSLPLYTKKISKEREREEIKSGGQKNVPSTHIIMSQ